MVLFASDRVQLSFTADPGWKGRAGLNISSITFFVAIIIIITFFVAFIIITFFVANNISMPNNIQHHPQQLCRCPPRHPKQYILLNWDVKSPIWNIYLFKVFIFHWEIVFISGSDAENYAQLSETHWKSVDPAVMTKSRRRTLATQARAQGSSTPKAKESGRKAWQAVK